MKRVLKAVLLIAWMGLIFFFSNQGGEASSNLSDGLLEMIFKNLSEDSFLYLGIRKCAHVFLYFVLGLLIDLNMKEYFKNHLIVSLIVIVVYCITDEIHQSFIPGRDCQILDIFIDSLAGVAALIIKESLSKRKM